jgi:hypothetical protein
MKITKAELKEIIREEAYKFKKRLQLESELAEIQTQINEVEAGSLYDAGESAGKKWKSEFEKVPNKFNVPGETHTIKEDEVEMEEEEDFTMENEDFTMEDENFAMEEESDLALEEILAEIMSEDDAETTEECGTYEEGYTEESEEIKETEEAHNEMMAENNNESNSKIVSEQFRMKQLAGLIK